ncbi:hypothetical protein [Agrobacterium leguminum]|nr:hypothetical protein [Agrobacterium leguminum]
MNLPQFERAAGFPGRAQEGQRRGIARQTSIDRKTVRKYVERG